MPPAFVNQPHAGPIETPEGNMMLERGQKIMAKSRTSRGGRTPTLQEIESELGSVEGFFTMFSVHYCQMFANPRMSVLFDTRIADTNVNAYEHGKRIASVLLTRWAGTNHFSKLNRGSFFGSVIETAHQKAKKCPMRPQIE